MTKTNNIKLHIHRLSFEMTRQCNLACAHCARGEAQDAIIKREYIDRVLDQIDYVQHLTLTGGEPSLYPDLIEYVVNGIIERGIRVRFFDITINGTVRGMRIAAALDKIADWCGRWQVYADHLEVDGVPDKSDGVASLRMNHIRKASQRMKCGKASGMRKENWTVHSWRLHSCPSPKSRILMTR